MKQLLVGLFFALGVAANADDRIHCVELDRSTNQPIEAKSKGLVVGKTDWLKPAGSFTFKVECLEQLASQYRLKLHLYRDDKALATAEVLIARNRPLIWQTPEKTWRVWVD